MQYKLIYTDIPYLDKSQYTFRQKEIDNFCNKKSKLVTCHGNYQYLINPTDFDNFLMCCWDNDSK